MILMVFFHAFQNYVVVAKQVEPVWKKPFFPYMVAACSVVLILSAGVLVSTLCLVATRSVVNHRFYFQTWAKFHMISGAC